MHRHLQLLGAADVSSLSVVTAARPPDLADGVYVETSVGGCVRVVIARRGVVLLDGLMPAAEVTQARLNALEMLFAPARAG